MKEITKNISRDFAHIYYYLHYHHEEQLSHQAVRFLQHIGMRKQVSIGELSTLLQISHNTASEHVKRLLKEGFVKKERSSEDERIVLVKLTEKGEAALERNTQLDIVKLDKLLEKFSEDEQERIYEVFIRLSEEAKRFNT